MIVIDVDPRKAVVVTKFADGTEYTYSMADLTREEHGPVLAAAMGWATLELKDAETRLKVWQAEQFLELRKTPPLPVGGGKPKRLSEKDVEASIKTTEAFSKMRGHVGRAAACANMLEVMAALVSAGKFTRKDRAHSVAGGRS